MSKPIIVVDFDGVIHSYTSGWKGPEVINDPPVPGALDWLVDAVEDFEIQILSSRSSQAGGREAMKTWLVKQYEHYNGWSFDEAFDFVWNILVWPLDKPPAFMTIDDRAFQFEGTFPPLDWVKSFKPWNKRPT